MGNTNASQYGHRTTASNRSANRNVRHFYRHNVEKIRHTDRRCCERHRNTNSESHTKDGRKPEGLRLCSTSAKRHFHPRPPRSGINIRKSLSSAKSFLEED